MGDIEEKVERKVFDPRREASNPPPAGEGDDEQAMRVSALPRPSPELFAAADRASPASRTAVTSVDPRFSDLDPLVQTADWDGVLRLLGDEEQAERLPPNLGLLWALARKEKEGPEAPAAASVTALAIRCTAGVLGVPPESPLALLIAKRMLRKNPVAWQQRPAPPARVSALIVVGVLLIGCVVGWFAPLGRLSALMR